MPIFYVAFSSREMLVKRQILFLLIACITRNGVPSPASQAILRRSAWSIPMFRADAPPIHLTNRRTFALFTTAERAAEHLRELIPEMSSHVASCAWLQVKAESSMPGT